MYGRLFMAVYRKRGNIYWAKLLRFSRALQKFSRKYSFYYTIKLHIMALF